MASKKVTARRRIHYRIRKKINGTAERPRLVVFRSNKAIYCQVIDDLQGHTLASASSQEDSVDQKGNKSEQAKQVGTLIGDRLKEKNIETVVFDRAGYLYHGRVKALADGARERGIKF